MSTKIQGTSGSDFIHQAGDGRVAPPGYDDITGIDGKTDYVSPGGGSDFVYGGSGTTIIDYENDAHDISGVAEHLDGGHGTDQLIIAEIGDFTIDLTRDVFKSIEELDVTSESHAKFLLMPSEAEFDSYHLEGAELVFMSAVDDKLRVFTQDYSGVTGSSGDDVLSVKVTLAQGEFTLSGGDGNDVLTLSLKHAAEHVVRVTTLDGGDGNDQLIDFDKHKDVLIGGAGADRFTIADLRASGLNQPDKIKDFQHNQGDHIDLSMIDGDSTTPSTQGFHLGGGAFTGSAGELIQTTTARGDTLLEGDVNGDGTADFAIKLDGGVVLVQSDIIDAGTGGAGGHLLVDHMLVTHPPVLMHLIAIA